MKCAIGKSETGEWHCEGETDNPDEVCNGCKTGGWTGDPTEVMLGIANDPELSQVVPIRSPFDGDNEPPIFIRLDK